MMIQQWKRVVDGPEHVLHEIRYLNQYRRSLPLDIQPVWNPSEPCWHLEPRTAVMVQQEPILTIC